MGGRAEHSPLGPSAAKRWISCTPSVKLAELFPERDTEYSKEGDIAHAVAELFVLLALGRINQEELEQGLIELEHDDDMLRHARAYADYVTLLVQTQRELSTDKPIVIGVEERVYYDDYVEDGFGTSDFYVSSPDQLDVLDYKYGAGVFVSVKDNPQLRLYALGVLQSLDLIYHPQTIRVHVYQPRLDNIAVEEFTYDELVEWTNRIDLAERARLAWSGRGEYVAGDHCQFCPARYQCRALYEYSYEEAREEFTDPDLIQIGTLAEMYSRLDTIKIWIKAVEARMRQLLQDGQPVPRFKLVNGGKRRSWADPEKTITTLLEHGFTAEQVSKTKPKGIGDIEKLMSKDDFEEIVLPLIAVQDLKPAVVAKSDKRPGIGRESALLDFADLIDKS